MPYLIGTDEAGYGPRLGPLLISLSIWRSEQPSQQIDLYAKLKEMICRADETGGGRLKIDDSKKLYQSGGSLRSLELPVLSLLEALHRPVETWRDAWELLIGDVPPTIEELPWYCDYQEQLPIDATRGEISEFASRWNPFWQETGCELISLRTKAIFPSEMNREIETLDSKAEVLTKSTLELIGNFLTPLPADETLIVCDKHGGRNYYLPALQRQFPEPWFGVVVESRQESRYQFTITDQQAEICFRRQAESFLPTALASLASKYLRELAMRAFNRYWADRIENLKPTAGYPADAARFRNTIEPLCGESDLPLHTWWRMR